MLGVDHDKNMLLSTPFPTIPMLEQIVGIMLLCSMLGINDVVLYCIVLYCIVLYCIVWYRIVSYRIVSYRIVSYRIVSYRIVSYRIVSYRIVSYRIVSYRIVSYRIVSYRIVSYRIVSYRIVSYCTNNNSYTKNVLRALIPLNRVSSLERVSNRLCKVKIQNMTR